MTMPEHHADHGAGTTRADAGTAAAGSPRIGANYVPREQWWYAWQDWDAASIGEDLHAIAELGMDHVRIQCLWTLFQPSPTAVSPVALERLAQLHDLADQAGLDVVTTVLDGWLSGFDFRPHWLGGANVFTDPRAIQAQALLLREVAGALRGHPRLLGIDLGNEINVLSNATPADKVGPGGADRWARDAARVVREALPGVPVMVGVDNGPLTMPDCAISLDCAATVGDVSCVHAWPLFSGALERYGHEDPGAYAIADYLVQLFRAHHADPDRPVWVQEFGLAPEWVPDDAFEAFVERQVRATLGIDGLWGATWWCSHDIDRRFGEFVPLEYDLGLLDVHNRIKPAARILRDAIARIRAGAEAPAPRTEALAVPAVCDGLAPADPFFAAYREGREVALVQEHLAGDESHLRARGITTVDER